GEDFKSKSANGRNGAFAQALISVLDDSPANEGGGKLSLAALDRALTAKIGTLSGGRQHPALLKPDSVSNFAIASRGSALETHSALMISGPGVVGSGPVP